MKPMDALCNATFCVIWLAQLLVAQSSRDDATESVAAVESQPKAGELRRPALYGSIGGCFAAACQVGTAVIKSR